MKSARSSEIKETFSRKSEKLDAHFSKEPFPFSKAGLDSAITWFSFSNFVVTHHVQRGALRKPRAAPGFEPRFSKDHHSNLSSLVACAVSFAEITEALSESA